jgi:hypothetical protein
MYVFEDNKLKILHKIILLKYIISDKIIYFETNGITDINIKYFIAFYCIMKTLKISTNTLNLVEVYIHVSSFLGRTGF